jgi:hypothetical protein
VDGKRPVILAISQINENESWIKTADILVSIPRGSPGVMHWTDDSSDIESSNLISHMRRIPCILVADLPLCLSDPIMFVICSVKKLDDVILWQIPLPAML